VFGLVSRSPAGYSLQAFSLHDSGKHLIVDCMKSVMKCKAVFYGLAVKTKL